MLMDTKTISMICLAVGVTVAGGGEGRGRAADLPDVGFQTAPGEVSVTIAGKPVATYVYTDERILRPYFAQVKAPDGIEVTRNHPPDAGRDTTDHDTMHPGTWYQWLWRLGTRGWQGLAITPPKSVTVSISSTGC
jgi:hypothetical protein